jgi:hypothetical protein
MRRKRKRIREERRVVVHGRSSQRGRHTQCRKRRASSRSREKVRQRRDPIRREGRVEGGRVRRVQQ